MAKLINVKLNKDIMDYYNDSEVSNSLVLARIIDTPHTSVKKRIVALKHLDLKSIPIEVEKVYSGHKNTTVKDIQCIVLSDVLKRIILQNYVWELRELVSKEGI